MSSVYCSQAHPNLPGSRFCQQCGEPLGAVFPGVKVGGMLGDRYRVVKELGQGGFGKTYLAEDLHRFREACVLKEFAPQVRGREALKKAEELFEREAGVLYQLQHPQIPRFRELFRLQTTSGGRLFLVQDYVEGQSYRELLETRLTQKTLFSEAEVLQLMLNLLPVLQYIHNLGVIHRDIAPDNLILRTADQMPVLIDFGGVKQIAVSVTARVTPMPTPVTRVGKVGYAPAEQMEDGEVSPRSDLYALAVTAVVLLTGQEPEHWLGQSKAPNLKRLVKLTPQFNQVLDRMLAPRPGDRFANADAVLKALRNISPKNIPVAPAQIFTPVSPAIPVTPSVPTPRPTPSTTPTLAVSPSPPLPRSAPVAASLPDPAASSPLLASAPTHALKSASTSSHPTKRFNSLLRVLFVLLLMGSSVAVVWMTRDRWLPLTEIGTDPEAPATPNAPSDPQLSQQEQSRKEALSRRRRDLGVELSYLVRVTDDAFYRRYPQLNNRSLTLGPEDEAWREKWDTIANEWLSLFEQSLSPAARKRLGSFGRGDRDAWRQAILKLNVGSQALNDLADGKFFQMFPDWRGQNFLEQPIGQVWHAIAADQVDSLQAGRNLTRIQFPEGANRDMVSGELEAGDGIVYLAKLESGQELRLEMEAPSETLLSIYVPKPTQQVPSLIEDSTDHTWSGELPQSGYYEFVIVSNSDRPIRYRLSITAE